MEAGALAWAEHLASMQKLQHSNSTYGENLAIIFGMDWRTAVDAWYNEARGYNYSKPGFGEFTGHFTQLVWYDTLSIGCGMKSVEGPVYTLTYIVMWFFPRGNMNNEYPQNVYPLNRDPEDYTIAPSPPRPIKQDIPPSPPRMTPPPPRIAPSPPRTAPPPPRIAPSPPRIAPSPPRIAPSPPRIAPSPPRIAPSPPRMTTLLPSPPLTVPPSPPPTHPFIIPLSDNYTCTCMCTES